MSDSETASFVMQTSSALSKYLPNVQNTGCRFEHFTVCVDGVSVVNVTVRGIDIALQTEQDDVDVVVVGLSTTPIADQEFDDRGTSNCLSNSGTLNGDEVSVTIVNASASSDSNTSIIIVFDNVGAGVQGSACVWKNETSGEWDSFGCTTETRDDHIICSCNHLTTFGTVRGLHSDCPQLLKWFDVDAAVFLPLCGGFTMLFAAIVAWVAFHVLRLKVFLQMKHLWKEHVIKIVSVVALLAAIQCTMLLELFVLSQHTDSDSDTIHDVHVALLTVLTLLPLPFYYVLFSLIIVSWINIAHMNMSQSTEMAVKSLKRVLKALNVVVFMLFILIIAALQLNGDDEIERSLDVRVSDDALFVGEVVWCSLMSLSAVLCLAYGVKVLYIVHRSNRIIGQIAANRHQKAYKETACLPRCPGAVELIFVKYFICCLADAVRRRLSHPVGLRFIVRVVAHRTDAVRRCRHHPSWKQTCGDTQVQRCHA